MALSESWFGDMMQTKYLVTLTFNEPQSWKDYNTLSYPGPAWTQLPDTKGMFHARVVIRDSSNELRICLHHTPMELVYGENPAVGANISVSSARDEAIHSSDGFADRWFVDLSVKDFLTTEVKDNSKNFGYQVWDVPMSTLLDNASYADSKTFKVTFDVDIKAKDTTCSGATHDASLKIAFSMAQRLKDPSVADVEFVFKSSQDEESRKLYAISSILEIKSTYYKKMFNSAFSEGKSAKQTFGQDIPERIQIPITHDFDLFHIVLFYLYTDKICLTTCLDYTSSPDLPVTNDAEGIYAIADYLLLDSLTSKALHFLESTCKPINITARTFGPFGAVHDAVGRLYDSYFMENCKRIMATSEFDEFFAELEVDSVEYKRANTKFRVMIKPLVS